MGLCDYKIHCFNGLPKIVLVCQDRFSKQGLTEDFFDIEWNHLDVRREKHPCSNKVIEQPAKLEKMVRLAEKLSNNIPILRIDFYIIKGNVYFGELTFFPASGFEKFVPLSSDRQFGDWITLPELEL